MIDPQSVLNYHQSVITKRNTDKFGELELIHIQNEKKQVCKGVVILEQLPYKYERVIVDRFTEVFDKDYINEDEFKVDYDNGKLFFNEDNEGEWINIHSYWGIGVELISASRVATEVFLNGDVKSTLDKDLKSLKKMQDDYDSAEHTNLIEKVEGDITIEEDCDRFNLNLDEYNPLIDNLYLHKDGVDLCENHHYMLNGLEVVMLGWSLEAGDVICYTLERGVNKKELKEVGADGSSIMNGTINKFKLSKDIQDKLERIDSLTKAKIIERYDNEFFATSDGITSFVLPMKTYNPKLDNVTLFYKNTEMFEGTNYTMDGCIVRLKSWSMDYGDIIHCITERIRYDAPPVGSDGGNIMDGSITQGKLSSDIQEKLNEIINITDIVSEDCKKGQCNILANVIKGSERTQRQLENTINSADNMSVELGDKIQGAIEIDDELRHDIRRANVKVKQMDKVDSQLEQRISQVNNRALVIDDVIKKQSDILKQINPSFYGAELNNRCEVLKRKINQLIEHLSEIMDLDVEKIEIGEFANTEDKITMLEKRFDKLMYVLTNIMDIQDNGGVI